ncbi:MAG TPA: HEAT repeat domain-containing protein [Gemmata sp.]|jgi:hypothetical protein|nr:HEAT repeat domain-containing protein [Gemmata sp.]
MTGSRLALVLTLVLGTGFAIPAVGLGDGGLFKPTRIEPARIHQLIQIIQSDLDEMKRKAAVAELGRADPRLSSEVIQAVTEALLKDPSPAVRLTAVEVIGRFNTVFPMSGLALESTMELDASPVVRKAAKQALWEYHLIGYKSGKSGNEFAAQTPEPPRAKPARLPVPVTAEPPVVPVLAQLPRPTVAQLPPVGPSPGPRVSLAPQAVGPAALLTAVAPHPNLTVEPPLALNSSKTVTPPMVYEPPILQQWPEPWAVGTLHPFTIDLPAIVSPPGPIPGVTPFPESTAEPPIRKSNHK